MTTKTINHLGTNLDRQLMAGQGQSLPQSLRSQLQMRRDATSELKSVLTDCLPDEILDNCWVVHINDTQLTLAVTSTTAANHIIYLQQSFIKILKEQSTSFTHLAELKVIVAHLNTV